jgi:hypothetical protein
MLLQQSNLSLELIPRASFDASLAGLDVLAKEESLLLSFGGNGGNARPAISSLASDEDMPCPAPQHDLTCDDAGILMLVTRGRPPAPACPKCLLPPAYGADYCVPCGDPALKSAGVAAPLPPPSTSRAASAAASPTTCRATPATARLRRSEHRLLRTKRTLSSGTGGYRPSAPASHPPRQRTPHPGLLHPPRLLRHGGAGRPCLAQPPPGCGCVGTTLLGLRAAPTGVCG